MSLDPDCLQLNRYGRASSLDRPFQKECNFETEVTWVRSRNPCVAPRRPFAIARCLAQAIGSVGLPGATAVPVHLSGTVLRHQRDSLREQEHRRRLIRHGPPEIVRTALNLVGDA
jgi:hypothetical protein